MTSTFRVVAAADMYPSTSSTEVKKTLQPNVVWRGTVETAGGNRWVGTGELSVG